MIKVFLVEDEYAIREGIKKTIRWERDGFELVGEAGDGEVAFPKILKTKPDILITDIRMPFMDGLELSRLVKKEMPGIKIVVLSGYDDFNYAREAISIGVEEYILKPVSEESLMTELKKIADSIRAERMEDEAKTKYLREREEIRMLEQQKFFHDMIDGKLSIQDSLTIGKKLGIDIAAEYYLVVLMQAFPGNAGDSGIDSYSGTKEEIYSKVKALYDDVENVYLYEQVGDVLCFLEKADSLEEMKASVLKGIESIKNLMKNYNDVLYFVSIGKPVERIRDVNISYGDASRKFAERFMLSESRIFYGSGDGAEHTVKKQVSSKDTDRITDSIDLNNIDINMISEKTILHFLKNGSVSEIDDFTEEYFESMGKEAVGSMMLRQYVLVEAMLSAAAFMKSIGSDSETKEELPAELSNPMNYVDSAENAKNYIRKLLEYMLEMRNRISDMKYTETIEKAKAFIRDNYQNDDMSLQTVASYVNVSTNHFSAIFRRETGDTFIDYLTTVRMEKAKTLLVCTPMKTSDVGFEVGYRDPHYFSYIFKKSVGMSPKEYRKTKKES